MKTLRWAILLLASISICLFQTSPSFSQSSSVVINEIMYNPSDDTESCVDSYVGEWVEVKNISASKGSSFYIKDLSGSASVFTLDVEPGSYFVIASNKECLLSRFPNINSQIVYDLGRKIGNGLSNSGDTIFICGSSSCSQEDVIVWKDYPDKAVSAEDLSYAAGNDGSWKEANPTPGEENIFPEEGTKEQQQLPQPTINFSSPSAVSVGTPFSVSVTLKNFKPGTYSLKVLIGKGDKFYDGRTKGTNGEWLAWNAGWVDFPKITVGSSGSGSKTIQAKTDDIVAGSYLLKVRAYDGKNTFDSDTKSLKVTGTVASESSSSTTSKNSGSGEPSFAETAEGKGEVLGEQSPRGDKSKLNFYVILGIFGMVVGSGGFMLAFRRGVRRSQTPDTPEQESTPLSERSCTPNG